MKQNHSGSGQRLKALVAATPVLGPAARRVARIPFIKGCDQRDVGSHLKVRHRIGSNAITREAPLVQVPTAYWRNLKRKR